MHKGVLAVLWAPRTGVAIEPAFLHALSQRYFWVPQTTLRRAAFTTKITVTTDNNQPDWPNTLARPQGAHGSTRLQLVQPAACNWRAPRDASVQQGCGAVLHRRHAVEVSS